MARQGFYHDGANRAGMDTASAGPAPEHHAVIVVGGGPAGLPLAVVLGGGWRPYYRATAPFRRRQPALAAALEGHRESLLALDFRQMAAGGLRPVDFFNALHRPGERFLGPESSALAFRRCRPVDCLLLSREPVGGLWNNVPENLLTLSPGHWMEMAFYPLAQWAAETGRQLDPDALIRKGDLVAYYHAIPRRFNIEPLIRADTTITRVEPARVPHPGRFLLSAVTAGGRAARYTCDFLVYAAGQRAYLRRLAIPGESLPLVIRRYDRPEATPGQRILVVGGGRSADWAATELHDAGRHVTYVMRQPRANHWRLIDDSRAGLPYYARLAAILESRSPRLLARYDTRVAAIEPDGTVFLRGPRGPALLRADRVLLEVGGEADYDLFRGFGPLTLVEKRDRYRFQCMQMVTHPHSYESVDVPGLYPGGYLAAGIGNVVVAMHGTAYAAAADILSRLPAQI